MSALPPCAGQWRLFDSIDPVDHREAAALCRTCPMIEGCREQLRLAHSHTDRHPGYGPEGTWAGQLIGGGAISRRRIAIEDEAFTPDEAKRAWSAYRSGDRSDWASAGYRAQERRRSQRRRDAA